MTNDDEEKGEASFHQTDHMINRDAHTASERGVHHVSTCDQQAHQEELITFAFAYGHRMLILSLSTLASAMERESRFLRKYGQMH